MMTTKLLALAPLFVLGTFQPAAAQDVAFDLFNESGSVLVEFYASAANDNDWGNDILGPQVVGSGEYVTVTIGDGSDQCLYDVKMVFDDQADNEMQLDICTTSSLTIN